MPILCWCLSCNLTFLNFSAEFPWPALNKYSTPPSSFLGPNVRDLQASTSSSRCHGHAMPWNFHVPNGAFIVVAAKVHAVAVAPTVSEFDLRQSVQPKPTRPNPHTQSLHSLTWRGEKIATLQESDKTHSRFSHSDVSFSFLQIGHCPPKKDDPLPSCTTNSEQVAKL